MNLVLADALRRRCIGSAMNRTDHAGLLGLGFVRHSLVRARLHAFLFLRRHIGTGADDNLAKSALVLGNHGGE